MKLKSPKHKTETLAEPVLHAKSKKQIDPEGFELDLEQQNQVLKKMITRLKKK